MNYLKIFLINFYLFSSQCVLADFTDFVSALKSYIGYSKNAEENNNGLMFPQRIPYEISDVDEQFLTEAAKLTGVALSELDSCQQRVVLKLKSDCNKMNDEQLAKMAVHLLNCQSFTEGRRIFPCTEEMTIKDCTKDMDSDTWTSYHLMSNRARAVCYSIRQSQFRGLAEHTVNRLMDAARDQLKTLGKITNNQENLKNLAETTYDSVTKGQEIITKQQLDIQKAQFFGQLAIEDNIKRLVDEKKLILETHNQLVKMTRNIQDKLGFSLDQLQDHSKESRFNHKVLIEDLINIQTKTQVIFDKIDESSKLMLKQNEDFRAQYESTLSNLKEVNKTVHALVKLMGGTRQALEERLNWISSALGGTDLAVERLYLILWHSAFLLLAMLSCAFLTARASTRLAVVAMPSLNLSVALIGEHQHLDPILLGAALGIFVLAQTVLIYAVSIRPVAKKALPWIKNTLNPPKEKQEQEIHNQPSVSSSNLSSKDFASPSSYKLPNATFNNDVDSHSEIADNFKDYDFTPPVSRNGHYFVRSRSRSNTPLRINTSLKSPCHAKTRMGTPCKLNSLPGRDFCFRHQSGDSIMS